MTQRTYLNHLLVKIVLLTSQMKKAPVLHLTKQIRTKIATQFKRYTKMTFDTICLFVYYDPKFEVFETNQDLQKEKNEHDSEEG